MPILPEVFPELWGIWIQHNAYWTGHWARLGLEIQVFTTKERAESEIKANYSKFACFPALIAVTPPKPKVYWHYREEDGTYSLRHEGQSDIFASLEIQTEEEFDNDIYPWEAGNKDLFPFIYGSGTRITFDSAVEACEDIAVLCGFEVSNKPPLQ